MKKRWDEALRSLARRPAGPFRSLAYGVTGTPEGVPDRAAELARTLAEHGLEARSITVVEVCDDGSGAAGRPRFQSDVLPWVEGGAGSGRPGGEGEGGPGGRDARAELREVATGLAEFLGSFTPDADEPEATLFAPPSLVAPPEGRATGERSPDFPLVLVPRFEDLGADAEAIGASLQALLLRGAHVVLPFEGLDTRTREGRGKAAVALRLGDIKSTLARRRSLAELDQRRSGLEVYGPVPFGFERRGRKLVPLPPALDAVRRARELSARGLTRFDIALALNGEGRTWKDGSGWTGRRVDLVLRNPIYNRAGREEIA
jgi:hypothetical protein